MDFTQYQSEVNREETVTYPGRGSIEGAAFVTLGMISEAGEAGNKVKKAWRDDGRFTKDRIQSIKGEIGGMLWYAAQLCNELGCSLNDVAIENIVITRSRAARNVISGEGDER